MIMKLCSNFRSTCATIKASRKSNVCSCLVFTVSHNLVIVTPSVLIILALEILHSIQFNSFALKSRTSPVMKRQAADQLPFPLQQTLKKLPKVAGTLIALTILLSLINEFVTLNFPSSDFCHKNPTTISHQPTLGRFGSLDKNSVILRKPSKDAAKFETTRPQVETQGSSILNNGLPSAKSKRPDSPKGQDSVTQKSSAAQTDGRSTVTVPNDPTPPGRESETHDEIHSRIQSERKITGKENCDLFSGEWVPSPKTPYYTNATCYRYRGADGINCMTHGRPNMDYLKWRWKPDGCELPLFDPNQFLELVRGKSIAFVGDSLGWNQMESLMCLLSTSVSQPLYVPPNKNEKFKNRHWVYKDYDFNISLLWAPFLVNSLERPDSNDANHPHHLYLDEHDEGWSTQVERYSYIIISGGNWFWKAHMYYENRSLIGCYGCKQENVTQMNVFFGYEKAFRTAFRAINSATNFKGVTFLRTISPTHFEGGGWNEGGDCVRTMPFKRNETVLAAHIAEMHRIQLQELKFAQEEGSKRGLKFRVFDATRPMLLRPDGHPSKYGYDPGVKHWNDCLHWCLPGAVDTWNEFLLELLRREEVKN